MEKNINIEIITFKDGELILPVKFSFEEDTVWLRTEEIATLFERDRTVINRHIKNIYKEEELEEISTSAKNAQVQLEGKREVVREIIYYNLDMIISIGYRVKSKRGITFRKWATSVLKEYMLKGIAINKRRLEALNKVVNIQSSIIANSFNLEKVEVQEVINEYVKALELLDDYDHHCITKIEKITKEQYRLDYNEVRKIIDSMIFAETSNIFGIEKEKGVLEGIIGNIYQSAFGEEVYKTTQEKAANLLYFIIKDHPFVDGCKRIAATVFLYFLNKNNLLFKDGKKIISESTLAAVTLLLAESRADEKEIMINVILHFLNW